MRFVDPGDKAGGGRSSAATELGRIGVFDGFRRWAWIVSQLGGLWGRRGQCPPLRGGRHGVVLPSTHPKFFWAG